MKNWKRTFVILWIGQAFSQLSSSILQFALIWYLTAATKSGIMLSLSVMMAFLPQGLLGFFTGVLIDRFPRKKIMIYSDLFIALVGLLMILLSPGEAISPLLILIVLFFRAVGAAFHSPTLEAITPQIVPPEELTRCAGYSQALESVSMVISPALAAVLFATWSMQSIVFLDVLGALLAVGTLFFLHIPKQKIQHEHTKLHIIRESLEGMRILKSQKGMLELVMITTLYSMALMPVSALFPLMSMEYFGRTSTGASLVETIFSVGFLMGSLALAKWRGSKNRVYTIAFSYFMMAFALLGTFLLPGNAFPIFVFFAWLMGFSGPFYWGSYTPMLQTHFQEEYLGRVLSITHSIRLCFGPISLLFSGIIADTFGDEKWFGIAGVLVLLCAILLLTRKRVLHCDSPEKVKTDPSSAS